MMMSEFTQRTGVYPTPWEYEKIEEQYYAFEGTKDSFCADWVAKDGPAKLYAERVAYIDRLKDCLTEQRKDYEAEIGRLKAKISELELDLEKELDWQDADNTGTNMEQGWYEHLERCGRKLTVNEAKKEVADSFGFAPELVEIITEVSTYQVNKYHRLRKKETFERLPCYESTDWNYIRFNCRGWQYEMVNGQLRPYCS